MKELKKRTKIEAICLILLTLILSFSSVFGDTVTNDQDGTLDNGFFNPTFIWNSNGQSWIANATNLQTSLNLGGTTFLPSSTITINSTITLTSNVSLIGQGWRSIIKAGSSLGNHYLITNTDSKHGNDHIEIRNLQIDGNDPTHITTQFGILFTKVSWGIVDNVYIHDTGKDGIRGWTSNHLTFSHITADNTGHHAIMFSHGTSYSSISNCNVKDSHTESVIIEHPNVITGERNHHCSITNIVSEKAEQYGFFVSDGSVISFSGLITDHSRGEGFEIRDCNDVTLTNCQTINNVLGPGFKVDSTAENVVLSNCISKKAGNGRTNGYQLLGKNIILTNSISMDTGSPLYFNTTTSKDITISFCQFTNYTNSIIARGDNLEFAFNTFSHPSLVINNVFYIDSKATNIKILNNNFKDATTTSKKVNDLSKKAIVRDNIGFPTDYLMRNGDSITIGKNGIYSTALELAPLSRRIIAPKLRLKESGIVGVGEIITIKIEAVYYNGIKKTLEKIHTTNNYDYYFSDADWFALADTKSVSDQSLERINIYGKTTNSQTSAIVFIYFLTSG